MTTLNDRERIVVDVLRSADEHWLPYREITRRCGLRHWSVVGAIQTLVRRGILLKRAHEHGLPWEIEVSFAGSFINA